MPYRGASMSLDEIANELGVELVIEGSVRQASGQVRGLADDRVLAGSIAVDGSIRVLAEQVDEERLLARVDRTLREALASRFPAVRFADRIARVMAPVVIAIAVGATVEGGLMRGLSVLLIACPCALAVGPGLITVTRTPASGFIPHFRRTRAWVCPPPIRTRSRLSTTPS